MVASQVCDTFVSNFTAPPDQELTPSVSGLPEALSVWSAAKDEKSPSTPNIQDSILQIITSLAAKNKIGMIHRRRSRSFSSDAVNIRRKIIGRGAVDRFQAHIRGVLCAPPKMAPT